MKCSVQGCPGDYENRLIVHTVKQGGELLVFEGVPAEVCNVCSDMLLSPKTIRHLERMMQKKPGSARQVPLYAYA